MNKNNLRKWFYSALVFMIPVVANASLPAWRMIPAESQLTFTATQNGAPVTGAFTQFTADLAADLNDLPNSKIDIVIDINSISASYADLKTTLVSAAWFNATMFPKAEFKSTKFSKLDDKHYQAMGILTIRDKSGPIVLTFTADVTDPGKGVFVGSTVIKRTAFGVGQGEWANVDTVKDDVTVNFKIVAEKPKAMA